MTRGLVGVVSTLLSITLGCSHRPVEHPDQTQFRSEAIKILEKNFKFKCKEKQGASGAVTLCVGKLPDLHRPGGPYPVEVGIGIPPKYFPQNSANILLKLPGFNRTVFVNTLELSIWVPPRSLEYRLDEPAYQEYDLWGEFVSDRIVIAPFSTQNCDEYMEHLASSIGFRNFLDSSVHTLYRSGLIRSDHSEKIIVAAQSGAYRPLAKILKQPELAHLFSEIYLFDAIFGGISEFSSWLKSDSTRRFWAAYNVPFTEVGTERFATELTKLGIPFLRVPGPELREQDFLNNRIGLVRADQYQTHQSIYARYFGYFLKKRK